MTNKIYDRLVEFGADVSSKIMEGVNATADAVGATMGPAGKNVVMKFGFHDPRFTKDGVTVARNIFFKDPWKNLGAEIITGAALKTNERCGDGTSSSTVLARALCMGGKFDRSEVDLVINAVRSQAIPCKDAADWRNVALISSNNDFDAADAITNALVELGTDAQITVELNKGLGISSDIVAGMSFDHGFASPYFVTDTKKMIAELHNVKVLIYDGELGVFDQVLPYIDGKVKDNESLLILTRGIQGEALQTLILNKVKGGTKICAVAATYLKEDFLEDIRIMTGHGMADSGVLGFAKKIIVSHNKTIIIQGGGSAEEVEERCVYLRTEGMKDRLARLTGGVAVIRVGGITEAEAEERRDRVEDAINAVRCAIEEGIVAGGGMALYWASRELADGPVKTACEAPLRQIMKNADMLMMTDYPDANKGFNVRTGELCNLVESGIIDPVKVVCSALSDAASVAWLVLNTEVGIVEAGDE